MPRFIIKDKVYDTTKMSLIGHVEKWYEVHSWMLEAMTGKKFGRDFECELYRSNKGNYLLVREDNAVYIGEAINESEAKELLMRYDYNNYVKLFGELEDA